MRSVRSRWSAVVRAKEGEERSINFSLLMLLPPFGGPSAASGLGITNAEDYINVDSAMRVHGIERRYAVNLRSRSRCFSQPGAKASRKVASLRAAQSLLIQ